jgi:hypothetical protein
LTLPHNAVRPSGLIVSRISECSDEMTPGAICVAAPTNSNRGMSDCVETHAPALNSAPTNIKPTSRRMTLSSSRRSQPECRRTSWSMLRIAASARRTGDAAKFAEM